MNHPDEPSLHQFVNDASTGIVYLPLPEPQLQLVKPQQSLDQKYQIEQDFSLRYRYFTDEEFNQLFSQLDHNDAQRYRIHYENLYRHILQSMFRIVDQTEEIVQIKHSIKYTNEVLPVLIHNHRLAKREKNILYHITTDTWRGFDERVENEVNVQNQLKQLKKEHEYFLKLKIEQEKYQTFILRSRQINDEMIYLKREIQQLRGYKRQLENEVHEIQTHCSHNLIQVDYLKSTIARHQTNELNNLQLERDSLITQVELIKYNLFEQMQEYDQILRNYRQSLNSFRSTLSELEQQLKQQTDIELNRLQISNGFQRQTIYDDTEKLITILEAKIEQKKLTNDQLQTAIEHCQNETVKQRQLLVKKEKDSQAMDQIELQLNDNISISREVHQQLKTERRTIERNLTIKLKEYTTDDRRNHSIIQQQNSLLARQRIEQIRIHTSTDQLDSLIDENTRLKTTRDQLYQQYTRINPKSLLQLQEKVTQLREMHRACTQDNLSDEDTKNSYQNLDERLQRRNDRISLRINQILHKFQQNNRNVLDNNQYFQILENQLNEEQHLYLKENYALKEMKNRSESYRTKQTVIQRQMQIVSNHIQHSQYRLKIFTEQLFLGRNDLVEQYTSLNKLREFHDVLNEQDEINRKKLSTITLQLIPLRKQCQVSQKSLQQIKEDRSRYTNVRSGLGRMVVRRVNLCQLLYKKLARIDEYICQRDENLQMINQCINSLKIQIHQIRTENKKFLQRKDQLQLETLKVHLHKMLDRSHQKQQFLTEQIFQRHYTIKHSLDRLPTEEPTYLKNKFFILKNRLIKMIFRGIICNFVLFTIQQGFVNHLESYQSKPNRENHRNLNSLRVNLYQLMRQLRAKSAEYNMLIDYQYYFQFIQSATIEQLKLK